MDKLDLFGTFNKLCSFICYAHICLLHWCCARLTMSPSLVLCSTDNEFSGQENKIPVFLLTLIFSADQKVFIIVLEKYC